MAWAIFHKIAVLSHVQISLTRDLPVNWQLLYWDLKDLGDDNYFLHATNCLIRILGLCFYAALTQNEAWADGETFAERISTFLWYTVATIYWDLVAVHSDDTQLSETQRNRQLRIVCQSLQQLKPIATTPMGPSWPRFDFRCWHYRQNAKTLNVASVRFWSQLTAILSSNKIEGIVFIQIPPLYKRIILIPSYRYNGNCYTGETISLD